MSMVVAIKYLKAQNILNNIRVFNKHLVWNSFKGSVKLLPADREDNYVTSIDIQILGIKKRKHIFKDLQGFFPKMH